MTDIEKLTRASRKAQSLVEQNRTSIEMVNKVANSSTLKTVMALYENSAIKRMLKEVERQDILMQSVTGPLAELRQAGVFDTTSPIHEEFRKTRRMIEAFEAHFSLPEVSAVANLMKMQHSPMDGIMQRYAEQVSAIQKAMEAMRSPWLDTQQELKSVTSFAKIQGIGGMLARMPPFADQVSATLRIDLGDWRDKITWPEPVLTDLSARAEFYIGLGFDPSLTNFPAPAFQESTEIAGLHREPLSLVDIYGEPVPRADDDMEEEALIRTNRAHDWLQRLETNFRYFINVQMTATFDPDWSKHRLPNKLYDQWIQKRDNAIRGISGQQPMPLVAYADFKDYELVICKRDNWQEVFSSYFTRPESVRESFQRLYPIRVDTMHARPISQDDELLLYIEVKRLMSALRSEN